MEDLPEVKLMTTDEMLQRHCGEFGRWQLKHFVLTSLAWILEAFHSLVMIFSDRTPTFRCLSDIGCDKHAKSVCSFDSGSWNWKGGSAVSTVSQWNLLCSDKFKVGLVQSAYFGGCIIGAGVFGHLSDSALGRKGTLGMVCMLNALFGFMTSLSPNYYVYLLLRVLTGFSTAGVGLCAFVLATEPVGPSQRAAAGMSTFYFFSVGIILLSGIAYLSKSWRTLYLATSIPSLLFLVTVIPFISESPRWYLVRGRIEKAMGIMKAIAGTNGKTVPEGIILARDEQLTDQNRQDHTKEAAASSLIDVIRSPVTRKRLFLAASINFLCSVAYYGLNLNVVNLQTNIYLNVVINAVAEMPAYMITAILIQKFGRKPLGIGTLWFSGVFCFAGSLMGSSRVWKVIKMMCGVMGIVGIAGTYNLMQIYAAELFPTTVRSAAIGCFSQMGRMGAIVAPFIVAMGGSLGFVIFGSCGILAEIFVFFLPETADRPLYDTIRGIEMGEVNNHAT